MTEFFDPGSRSDVPTPGVGAVSPGAILRRAREAAGLHIAALAVSLKVPVKKLEALEADRFDLLPDVVFTRALAGSVARSLKLDPQGILPLLPQSATPSLGGGGDSQRISSSFRTPSFGSRSPWWSQVSRPAVIAGLVFVVGAALMFFLPKAQDKKPEPLSTEVTVSLPTPVTAPEPVVAAPAPGEAAAPAAASTAPAPSSAPTSSALAVQPPTSALPSVVAPSTTPTQTQAPGLAAKPAVAAAAPALPAPVAAAPGANLVTFTASKASWVEVVDARGTKVLRRQLSAGEVVGVNGVLPLKALVGRVDGTQVQVRGQAFDLAPVSKDNVARFEVK